ncbi:MAG TPA: isochorismatase family protein [Phycisphaerae bacterium]|nr:isochorismatase family protein [Phycisphaerae bacterium]
MELDRILLDIETQRDFFSPGGSLYTPQAARAARNVYHLFAWARVCHVPVISTVLRVRPDEIGPLADRPHCIEGTEGEQKLSKTVLARRINLGLRNTTDLPDHIFQHYQQVIFEKRHVDIFDHARAERLITELPKVTFVLCGAGVSSGILQAAVGLRNRGFGVILASDAVVAPRPNAAPMARLRMEAKGVICAPTEKIVSPRPGVRRRPFRHATSVGRQAF